jgi:hypothetical protein
LSVAGALALALAFAAPRALRATRLAQPAFAAPAAPEEAPYELLACN